MRNCTFAKTKSCCLFLPLLGFWLLPWISSNFIVFPFLAVSGCFCSSQEALADKYSRSGERDETEILRGWQGGSESAASAKRSCFVFGAKPALPKRPSEPRPSGAHAQVARSGK